MSCWWKTFIWIRVRFSIVSEKTMHVFSNGMKPCEPRSVDLHSAWGKRAVVSWYWGIPFLTGNITAWLVFRVSRLGDKSRIGLPESPPYDWVWLLAICKVLSYYYKFWRSNFGWTTNCVVFCLSFCLAKDLLLYFVFTIWFLNSYFYYTDSTTLTYCRFVS